MLQNVIFRPSIHFFFLDSMLRDDFAVIISAVKWPWFMSVSFFLYYVAQLEWRGVSGSINVVMSAFSKNDLWNQQTCNEIYFGLSNVTIHVCCTVLWKINDLCVYLLCMEFLFPTRKETFLSMLLFWAVPFQPSYLDTLIQFLKLEQYPIVGSVDSHGTKKKKKIQGGNLFTISVHKYSGKYKCENKSCWPSD